MKQRKKILWLCSWYPSQFEPFNGDFIQRHARAASLFHDIHVIHLAAYGSAEMPEKKEDIFSGKGLTEQIVYYQRNSSPLGRVVANLRWQLLFKRLLRKYVREKGKPDMVHVHVPMKAGMMALWFKWKYKIPYVVTEHWGIYNEFVTDRYHKRSRLFRHLTRRIFKHASRFISVSRFLARGVNQMVIHKEFEIIPNTTDTSLFYYKEPSTEFFRFIHVSNMVPLKNAEGILRAFAAAFRQNPGITLVMVGDTEPAIRQFASTLQLPEGAVRFTGEVSYATVAAEMQEAHCLVLFSHIENSPCVIGEALCCGLPVIASNVGGIPELVDETNSLLVNAGNEEELTCALLQVYSSYRNYNRKAIAEKATARFSYEQVGQQLSRVYESIFKPSM